MMHKKLFLSGYSDQRDGFEPAIGQYHNKFLTLIQDMFKHLATQYKGLSRAN